MNIFKNLYIKILLFSIAFIFFNGCSKKEEKSLNTHNYLVGAYYYVWYPKNFSYGTLRRKLDPTQPPKLGLYNSIDKKVIEKHIDWCSSYGIDFLAIDWWPDRPHQNKVIYDNFLKADNIKDIKFCIFYESWNLNFLRKWGVTYFDEKAEQKLISDVQIIADKFFDHPRYLKIDNKPVLIFYLTRTYAGSYKKAIKNLRKQLRDKGYDLYLIADEVYWEVRKVFDIRRMKYPRNTIKPQKKRIELFDAITAYNMYEFSKLNHKGYAKNSTYIQDVQNLSQKYIKVMDNNVAFIPNVIPGYNDRGVRPREDHFIIPRKYSKEDDFGSFFDKSIDDLVMPFIDNSLNMVLVTSFNEWNEDTNIEPLKKCKSTTINQGTPKDLFTLNYEYEGYDLRYLEILRDKFVAVSGFVKDKSGKPCANIKVEAYKDGKLVAYDSTNRLGIFGLSRLNIREGIYTLRINNKNIQSFIVNKEKTILLKDYIVI